MSPLRSLMNTERTVFNAGTDLVISLFAIMIVVLAFTAQREQKAVGELQELKDLTGADPEQVRTLQKAVSDASSREEQLRQQILDLQMRTELADTQLRDYQNQLAVAERTIKEQKSVIDEQQRLAELHKPWIQMLQEHGLLEKDPTLVAAALERAGQSESDQENRVRMSLLDLPENLDYVAFILDTSASMNADIITANPELRSQWDNVQAIMKRWIEYLPVQHARMITFNTTVRTFPEDSTFLEMTPENRTRMLQSLPKYPEGITNTLAAVEEALRNPDVQSVVLLTDGDPTGNQASEILARVSTLNASRSIPVRFHTVALGEFYQLVDSQTKSVTVPPTPMMRFLIQLAQDTGGSFRALAPQKLQPQN